MKNLFFIVYDEAELPICYAENKEELCRFTGLSPSSIWRTLNRLNKNPNAKVFIDGKKCTIKRFRGL